MAYGIYNKRKQLYFAGWKEFKIPVWRDKEHALLYTLKFHAEFQTDLLANYHDGDTVRQAVEL